MYCKKCGGIISNDSVYCSHCGSKQDDLSLLTKIRDADNEYKSLSKKNISNKSHQIQVGQLDDKASDKLTVEEKARLYDLKNNLKVNVESTERKKKHNADGLVILVGVFIVTAIIIHLSTAFLDYTYRGRNELGFIIGYVMGQTIMVLAVPLLIYFFSSKTNKRTSIFTILSFVAIIISIIIKMNYVLR